tara:strand:- start:126 stop:335 length:210 start_codon:yes stop_codon:yes gene_type:complete
MAFFLPKNWNSVKQPSRFGVDWGCQTTHRFGFPKQCCFSSTTPYGKGCNQSSEAIAYNTDAPHDYSEGA